jgi:hypothetical protein
VGQRDYTAELTKLIGLTDAGQQREAIVAPARAGPVKACGEWAGRTR